MSVKCLNCRKLKLNRETDGMSARCGLGHYDQNGIRRYFSIRSVVLGTSATVNKAADSCGDDYDPVSSSECINPDGKDIV